MWWILLVVFPVTCGLIGWVTNVLAVKMIFRPYEPQQIVGRVRFQGVLPKHLDHFSEQLAAIVVSEFVTLTEMIRAVDAPELIASVRGDVDSMADRLTDVVRNSVPETHRKLLTDETVAGIRSQFEEELSRELPEALDFLTERAEEVLDLREVIAANFFQMGPKRVEGIMYEVSAKELRFIEVYGGVFGAMLGFVQLVILRLIDSQLVVPVLGLIIGAFTNYLAIQMLFHPSTPKKIFGGVEWQGLFPKRQREIASHMGRVAARDVIQPVGVFQMLANRILPERLEPATVDRLEQGAKARWPAVAMLSTTLPDDARQRLFASLAVLYGQERNRLVAAVARAAANQLDISEMVEARVSTLSQTAFADIIRGLFEQEELYLIVYGGLLGMGIGIAQVLVTGWLT